jgi:trans-2-enoyl-CoA reductase
MATKVKTKYHKTEGISLNQYQQQALQLLNQCSDQHQDCCQCPRIVACTRLWDDVSNPNFDNLYRFKQFKRAFNRFKENRGEQDDGG